MEFFNSIVLQTIKTATSALRVSAFYVSPLFITTAIIFGISFYTTLPWYILLILIVALVFSGTTYTTILMQHMLSPRNALPPFETALRWQERNSDFVLFVGTAFLLLGFAIIVLFDATLFFLSTIENLEDKIDKSDSPDYAFQSSSLLLFLLGSKIAATAASLIGLFLWFYLFRMVIRIPAHADGYNVRNEEAMELTYHFRWSIFFSSLLINGALLVIAVWLTPWSIAPTWLQAILAAGGVWGLLHTNIAYAVVLYQILSPGYTMQKLPY